MTAGVMTLGWREWVGLPQLGIERLRAKLDTGARSSALHVDSLETFMRDDAVWLRFDVSQGRHAQHGVTCETLALGRRVVTNSSGHRAERWFIRSQILLAGHCFDAEISLTDRRGMRFPLLLGRTALNGRFRVDPALSHVADHAAVTTLSSHA
jgi:hypothetical protein